MSIITDQNQNIYTPLYDRRRNTSNCLDVNNNCFPCVTNIIIIFLGALLVSTTARRRSWTLTPCMQRYRQLCPLIYYVWESQIHFSPLPVRRERMFLCPRSSPIRVSTRISQTLHNLGPFLENGLRQQMCQEVGGAHKYDLRPLVYPILLYLW